MAKIDLEKLKPLIEEDLISVQKHPSADLWIYNYTQKCQFTRAWTPETLMCRGLILDKEGNIVARPFPKFFNVEEVEDIPNEPFEVYEKLDGSLGILYWIPDSVYPWIATRGSFTSDQSKYANKLLMKKYAHWCNSFSNNKTYLFEIIYPENRIVVNYGSREELVLLAIIDTETGREENLYESRIVNNGYPTAKLYSGFEDPRKVKEAEQMDNAEGYVLLFKSGYRLKVKFDEYVRLHRIVTGVSKKSVWEHMRDNNGSIDALVENVPDEFFQWVKGIYDEITSKYEKIMKESSLKYDELRPIKTDRKAFAMEASKFKYPGILFAMLDGKDSMAREHIYKLIKPQNTEVFKTDEA